VILLLILFFSSVASAAPQNAPATPDISGARFVQDHGWPELQVDGKPFFVNGAAFDYFGVPQDLWAHSLDRYHELGINTIDLTIPWNWHETADGEFDFDGHSNPRRDLRGLLRLIADRGFKLIVHVGPQMPDTWRLAGYPEWLVSAPDYGMTAQQIGDGAEPPLAAEFHSDADAAAAGWLAREDFLRASQQWFSALARELAPYGSDKKLSIDSPDTWGKTTPHEASGPLLFVVVGQGAGDGAKGSANSRASVAPNVAVCAIGGWRCRRAVSCGGGRFGGLGPRFARGQPGYWSGAILDRGSRGAMDFFAALCGHGARGVGGRNAGSTGC
jgi:hypothetical protein